MTPIAWEFGRIFQEFPFLQKAPERPHNMRIMPLSHAKKDLNILESWSFFAIVVCIEP